MDTIGDYLAGHSTEPRLKAEARAAKTPAQRKRRGPPPKVQVNFRASTTTRAQLEALSKALNVTVTDVIELAVQTLAETKLRRKS
jgi:hypothetical protein